MELAYFYDKQKQLDQFIYANNGIEPSQYITDLKIIAFKVELSELANELQTFKYWKKNIDVDKAKAIEELMDCIHFLISIALDRNYNTFIDKAEPNYTHLTMNEILFALFEMPLQSSTHFKKTLEMLLSIADKLDMIEVQIRGNYKKKFNKNMKRQLENY